MIFELQIAYVCMRDENARLKRLVADLTLDKHILSEAMGKSFKPVRRRELAQNSVTGDHFEFLPAKL